MNLVAEDLVSEGTFVGIKELLWEQVSKSHGNCVEECKQDVEWLKKMRSTLNSK